ncbi:hypothetical protein, partial [uncultured Oscillibacter sp.]|uniref:hypothetical protein n=1 Tax=uncultured Oscillibacter sp. TaxID=876091 RepID=UPI00260D0EEB
YFLFYLFESNFAKLISVPFRRQSLTSAKTSRIMILCGLRYFRRRLTPKVGQFRQRVSCCPARQRTMKEDSANGFHEGI